MWAPAIRRYPDRQGGARETSRQVHGRGNTIPSPFFVEFPHLLDNQESALLNRQKIEVRHGQWTESPARSLLHGGRLLAPLPAGRGTSRVPAAMASSCLTNEEEIA